MYLSKSLYFLIPQRSEALRRRKSDGKSKKASPEATITSRRMQSVYYFYIFFLQCPQWAVISNISSFLRIRICWFLLPGWYFVLSGKRMVYGYLPCQTTPLAPFIVQNLGTRRYTKSSLVNTAPTLPHMYPPLRLLNLVTLCTSLCYV